MTNTYLHTGDRFQRIERRRTQPWTGRADITESRRHIASNLPNLTADVCGNCNNGWMASMEIKVRDLLDPLMKREPPGWSAVLSIEQQTLLATWFSKCAYAYGATYGEQNRPWTPDEYEELRINAQPSALATIWAGWGDGASTNIGLSLTPVYLTPLEPGVPESNRPTMASAWLSANGVVFYGLWTPPELVEDGLPEELAAVIQPMMRIWPPSESTIWPEGEVTDDQAEFLVDFLATVRDLRGIPTDELTAEEVARVKAELVREAAARGIHPTWAIESRVLFSRPEDSMS